MPSIDPQASSSKRPLHLQPPEGINILPPSPIDPTNGSPFRDSSTSPIRGNNLAPSPSPLAADSLSRSPSEDAAMLLSPSRLSRDVSNEDDKDTTSTPGGSGSPLVRVPSPSSPNYRPKPTHHRRTSSSHQVRETVDGSQTTTEDGRLVNQYRIGKSLGQGAYAKVELGVDVTTGKEYVSHLPLNFSLQETTDVRRRSKSFRNHG
jgi:[calcium/calmodulin-dependent protein kinase] kinase